MSKHKTPRSIERRNVLIGGAAVIASLLPKSGQALLVTAQGDAPTNSNGGGYVPKLLDGKTVLITGATDGLGKAVAVKLAEMGAVVLLHGRDDARGEALAEHIRKHTDGCGKFYRADLSSLNEVRKLAETIRRDNRRLDVLINNAGIGSTGVNGCPDREVSADGYELRFAVNYLAGYALTRQLVPMLEKCAPSRIINVASLAQHQIDFDDVMLERGYDGSRAYAQSKLAQVMFTRDLAEQLIGKQVTVNSIHPATYMDTTMVRAGGIDPRSSVEEGANAVVYLATAPELKARTGLFFNGKREMRANAMAYNSAARARLRALSERLTNV